ncbi:S-layer homology domain-containing protein [Butyricicoccus sp. AM05-1]|uniref:S-layer homology domain-containing protein n=1 Tax=Butyricicoccus sp. AM05-1 TaxID=2292004 RepID=UPI001FA9A754|nr:S-layer homology domain-containing protein [Butyricicoccus sp. AM05-1]
MKRRLLSAFLAVMMVLTMAPVAFAADEDAENTADGSASAGTGSSEVTSAVAKIGDATYSTLADAVVNAKTGDTIVMTAATDISKTGLSITSGKDITLDLNGYEVKAANTGAGNIKVYGKLTLKDSTDTSANGEGQGKITTVTKTYIRNQADQPIIYAVNGDFVMQSGLIDTATGITNNSDNGQFGVGVQNETANASVTIEGGKIKAGWYAVSGNGQMLNHDGNITVNGGILESTADYAIYHPQAGTTTINGGVIYGHAGGIQINRGTLVVNNGTVTSKGIGSTGSWGDGTGGTNNAAIHANAKYGDVSVSIKDGKVTAEGNAVTIVQGTKHTATVAVSGGTFSSDVSAYCEKNYYTEKNADNTYTVKSMKDVAVAKIDDTYYKTLADAVAAAQNGATVKLLANINGQTVIPADKNIVLDLNGKTMTHTGTTLYNSGTLVVKDSSADKSGKIVSTGNVGIGVNHNSTTTIEYANIQAQEGAVITGYATGATITIEDGVFTALDNAVVAGNGNKTDKNTEGTPERVNANKITINGGTFNGMIKTSGYVACGIYAPWKDNIVVNGGTFNITGGAGIVARGGIVVVNNGEFNTTGNATGKVGDSRVVVPCSALVFDSAAKYPSLTNDSKIQINDGKFKSDVDTIKVVKDDTDMNSRVIVGGGYFTTDPSAYVASGYVAGTSDVSGYSYKVVAKTDTGNVEVKPAVSAPEVKVSESISKEDKAKVEEAAKTVSAPTLGAETGDIVKDINEDTAKALIKKATTVPGDNKKLYVQSSLKVEPTAYDAANKTLALEITPQYRVVASTADTADKIKLDGDTNTKNAQVVQDYQTMNITKATVVTMELPTGFAVADGDKLSIQHTKSNDKVEYYTGTVTKKDDKLYLTFTTNGFSPFVISVPEAAIESKVYPTLQAAVDSAKNDDIIDLYKDVAPDTKVTVAKTIKFKIATNSKKFDAAKNIVAGSNTTVKVTGESSPYIYEFTYTKPSSGSSGGSSSGKTTYKVTTSAVNNGGVNASPSNAEKGATITLTLSPDKGYKLDKLTVTDGSGKSVSTVKKSDTVYTFTMPASAVTVGVSYAKADETPSKTTFNDVSANDWFASAVDYVTGKGMMNGTAANTFSPKANTTRGMLMTVLARHAGEDTTGGSVWYEKGMNWAKANGVSDGTNPQVNITREQLAAMLYRYAQNKKYDVSGAKSLDGYTDAQSVSSYAVPALQWANAAGVVNGKSGSKLDPKGYATRAEVAAMLMRFCENVEK